jgi:GH24 family phage-related lysozyme (muramidase)
VSLWSFDAGSLASVRSSCCRLTRARLHEVPLNQQQFDALISFTFNCGEGALTASTLRKRLNRREYAGVPSELNKWVMSGGKKLEGLIRRRKAEGALFSKGRYQ